MSPRATTLEEYLQGLPPEKVAPFQELRARTAAGLPGWVESMDYGMPVFRRGAETIGLAAQKNYFSLYFCDPEGFLDAFRERLGKLDCGKGCVRFRRITDLSPDLLAEMLAVRHAVVAA